MRSLFLTGWRHWAEQAATDETKRDSRLRGSVSRAWNNFNGLRFDEPAKPKANPPAQAAF
jgi:hypothetical protein